jgi:hypothetical protein
MALRNLSVRLLMASAVLTFSLAPSALADLLPVDPHVMVSTTGGDAIPISGPVGITLTEGGGIFVFTNTGPDIRALDVNVQVPFPDLSDLQFTNNPSVLHLTFSIIEQQGKTCLGAQSSSFSCIKMVFDFKPGFIPTDQNFVMDFNDPTGPDNTYQGNDLLVQEGLYNGDSIPGVGGWGTNATATVIPVVPEPSHYGIALLAFVAFAAYFRRGR